jgi:hypothetical protein
MPKKYTIQYRKVHQPITDSVTKFGGQPVWIEAPQWPVSRMYGKPMQFICKIALPADLFGDLGARMAYLFLTDWDCESVFPNTMEPDRGENALILQPGGNWEGPTIPLLEGASLYRRAHRFGRWEQTPCEFDVELHPGDDPEPGAWDDVHSDDKVAWDAYFTTLCEDKIGGTPVPTPFGPRFTSAYGKWRLLLQLNVKDDIDPFFLNVALDGVGWAFVSKDGRAGKFLASR